MSEAQGVPKMWRIGIRKVEGRWMVERPEKKVHRGLKKTDQQEYRDGDSVEWTLNGKKGDEISAHFQFPSLKLFENHPGQSDLTQDMTARIAEPGATLKLKVHPEACRRRNPWYYAVWIQDETLENGGAYAVGEEGNPPPEIDIGP